jgi:phosphoribosylanthranilate isomerase
VTRPRVKICGLTRHEDAAEAVAAGADALGFILWSSSPRFVPPDVARAIGARLPPLAVRVGVFVNSAPGDVFRLADAIGLDALQLHGEEDVHAYAIGGRRLIKSITLDDDDAIDAALRLPDSVTPIIDAQDHVRRGGTGQVANWSRAARLAAQRPIILAGGLTPDNVADAIRDVRPWGVDVSSGVETSPGLKSAEKIRAFMTAVQRFETSR